MIYLDHNATSPLRPEALAAVTRASAIGGNPSSVHAQGRAARAVVEDAREAVAKLAGARAQDVIFTSGGTEANALALYGAVYGALEAEARITRIFVSAIEHPAVLANAAAIAERIAGVRTAEIPVTADGIVDVEALRVMLREGKGRTLVCVMAANNETGVIQPLDQIAKHVRDAGALLLVDAVQTAGKIPLAFDADYLVISGHKIGALEGTGALIVKEGAPLSPLVSGGGQERGKRGGTQNLAGIASFGAAAAVAASRADIPRQTGLRDRFESEIARRWPEAVVFGAKAPRLGNTSNFAIPGVTAETAMMALDLDGICVSSGAACSSGKVHASHVLKAMGLSDEIAGGALRASFGWNSESSDVDAVLASLDKLVSRARSRVAA
ncbi:MAG TPA: cysteine desulfurase family protein [Rhizomicrobium sp.]|nr:cysteine desulfurase family protein [Rhizomicrobium sp.]